MDSGFACLWMIWKCHNGDADDDIFQGKVGREEESGSLLSIGRTAERLGLKARCMTLTFRQLRRNSAMPCIIEWDRTHFAVCLPGSRWGMGEYIEVAEPSRGLQRYSRKEFLQHWTGSPADDINGGVLLMEPSFGFRKGKGKDNAAISWRYVLQLFRQKRAQVALVILALTIGSLVQLIFPFLMQGIVDVGVSAKDLHFVTVFLIAQFVLVCSRVMADLIRSRILLQVSTSINFSILSDFWIKLMHIPLAYFDRRHTGEILQRINDNRQVQNFVTGPALSTLFSMLNFVVFSLVLMVYKVQLFLIFIIGISLYFLWMRFFLKFRRKINTELFHASSKENNVTLQLVQGMQEIRLQNIEQTKRWEWEKMQIKIFRLNFRNLNYVQLQQAGAILINQGKDVLLTFIVAKLLIEGKLTFGAMLAVQYIIGQLSGPVEQFIGFVQSAQDAKISMERLNEVHSLENEEKQDRHYVCSLPSSTTITLNGLSFTYPGSNPKPVLSDIDLEIPEGKITALVGESGCGKTTLLKVLLKFYEQYEGVAKIGDMDFQDLSPSFWRSKCGAVLQDSYIFNDTIRRNIVMAEGRLDEDRLRDACRIANILPFIESFPNKFDAVLEVNGLGISQGQKQRLLIARAIYKDPEFVFFDESTNSLDEINERAVVKNLACFFENRTVILVAHRLNTVKDAHKIVVMHQGRIVEQGTHEELTRKKGKYFRLIKTQLELGVD